MYITHAVPPLVTIIEDAAAPAIAEDVALRVDAAWQRLLADRPGLYNGSMFSLAGHDEGRIGGFIAQYKWYAAQLEDASLRPHLRVQSLAVSGLVSVNGHLVFGRRRHHLVIESGLWELAPSGTLTASLREADGSLSWRAQFAQELREELGLEAPLDALRPFALVEKTETGIFELGVALELDADPGDVLGAYAGVEESEHDQLSIVPLADVPRFYKTRRKQMTGVTGPLLLAAGHIEAL